MYNCCWCWCRWDRSCVTATSCGTNSKSRWIACPVPSLSPLSPSLSLGGSYYCLCDCYWWRKCTRRCADTGCSTCRRHHPAIANTVVLRSSARGAPISTSNRVPIFGVEQQRTSELPVNESMIFEAVFHICIKHFAMTLKILQSAWNLPNLAQMINKQFFCLANSCIYQSISFLSHIWNVLFDLKIPSCLISSDPIVNWCRYIFNCSLFFEAVDDRSR